MFFVHGRLPAIFIFATSVLLAMGAHAQQNIPLTLAEAEDLALDSEPGQAALMAHAGALAERSVVAGQLPDPTLRVGINNFPIETGGFSTEGMTHALVGLRQAFPAGKSRSISKQQFASLADEMNQSADARNRDVLMAVRQAWLEAYYWQRADELVSASRPFFDDLAEISRSLYAVGRKNQQDVLRAQLELSRIDDRLLEIQRRQAEAHAALGEWVGTRSRRSIALKLPGWDVPPPQAQLSAGLLSHPSLQAADARIEARKAGVELAEEKYKPGWALDLGYSYRQGYLANGDPRSDFISLSVSVDLPFFGRKNRQDRSLAAALSERRAATRSKERLLRQLVRQLEAEYSRWQEVDRRIRLYEAQILLQTAEQAEAALLAYQSDRGDFADVMRGYIDNLDAQLQHIRLQVQRAQSYAALTNLGGLPR